VSTASVAPRCPLDVVVNILSHIILDRIDYSARVMMLLCSLRSIL